MQFLDSQSKLKKKEIYVEIHVEKISTKPSASYPGFRIILKISFETCFGKIFHETVWVVPQNA